MEYIYDMAEQIIKSEQLYYSEIYFEEIKDKFEKDAYIDWVEEYDGQVSMHIIHGDLKQTTHYFNLTNFKRKLKLKKLLD